MFGEHGRRQWTRRGASRRTATSDRRRRPAPRAWAPTAGMSTAGRLLRVPPRAPSRRARHCGRSTAAIAPPIEHGTAPDCSRISPPRVPLRSAMTRRWRSDPAPSRRRRTGGTTVHSSQRRLRPVRPTLSGPGLRARPMGTLPRRVVAPAATSMPATRDPGRPRPLAQRRLPSTPDTTAQRVTPGTGTFLRVPTTPPAMTWHLAQQTRRPSAPPMPGTRPPQMIPAMRDTRTTPGTVTRRTMRGMQAMPGTVTTRTMRGMQAMPGMPGMEATATMRRCSATGSG
ncbi:MAG: hypothetical protein JWR33_1875 [Naasia sp.]|nr:hypothetical protein [Naasia sp.]